MHLKQVVLQADALAHSGKAQSGQIAGGITHADPQNVRRTFADANEDFTVTPGFALGLQAQNTLAFVGGFECRVEIFLEVAETEQKRQWNVAAKGVF